MIKAREQIEYGGQRADYLLTRLPSEASQAIETLRLHGFVLAVGVGNALGGEQEWMGLEIHGPIVPTTQPCGCLANAQDAHRMGCPDHPEGKGLLINSPTDTEETQP